MVHVYNVHERAIPGRFGHSWGGKKASTWRAAGTSVRPERFLMRAKTPWAGAAPAGQGPSKSTVAPVSADDGRRQCVPCERALGRCASSLQGTRWLGSATGGRASLGIGAWRDVACVRYKMSMGQGIASGGETIDFVRLHNAKRWQEKRCFLGIGQTDFAMGSALCSAITPGQRS